MDVVEDVLVEGIIEVPAFGDAADGVETVAEKVDGQGVLGGRWSSSTSCV